MQSIFTCANAQFIITQSLLIVSRAKKSERRRNKKGKVEIKSIKKDEMEEKFTHPTLPLPIASKRTESNLFVISQRAIVRVLQSMSFSLSHVRRLGECLVHHFGISFALSLVFFTIVDVVVIPTNSIKYFIKKFSCGYFVPIILPSCLFHRFLSISTFSFSFDRPLMDTAMEQQQPAEWASNCGVYSFAHSQARSADWSIDLTVSSRFLFFFSAFYTCTNTQFSFPFFYLFSIIATAETKKYFLFFFTIFFSFLIQLLNLYINSKSLCLSTKFAVNKCYASMYVRNERRHVCVFWAKEW